ncbi:MAG: flavodoxin family protein [Candidatus Aminicenantes bacterium]|nr:MAG: flavodoxin family protein [Candidatus Aminicenantes bacterium]
MAKILVCYYSKTGNTEKMGQIIAKRMEEQDFAVDLKRVEETKVDLLLDYDCIILGSPTYYGSMAWPIKKLLDDSVKFHGQLRGKVGGAFSSAANIGGGNETTIQDMLNALLIHGMIIRGDHRGDHYGPVSIDYPNERALECCRQYAENLAELIKKLFS